MIDDQEPVDYATGTVSLEIGTKELRGEEVRAMDITIRVPDSVLREIHPDVIEHLADDLPDGLDVPGEAWDYAKEHHPRVVSDYLNERLRWEFGNVDLPDTCPV